MSLLAVGLLGTRLWLTWRRSESSFRFFVLTDLADWMGLGVCSRGNTERE